MTRYANVDVYVVHWLNRRGIILSCPAKGRGNNEEAKRVCAPVISEWLPIHPPRQYASVRILLLALESSQLFNCSSPLEIFQFFPLVAPM